MLRIVTVAVFGGFKRIIQILLKSYFDNDADTNWSSRKSIYGLKE